MRQLVGISMPFIVGIAAFLVVCPCFTFLLRKLIRQEVDAKRWALEIGKVILSGALPPAVTWYALHGLAYYSVALYVALAVGFVVGFGKVVFVRTEVSEKW